MKKVYLIALILSCSVVLTACEEKGPMEKAGETIDETVTEAGNAVEDVCEDTKEAAGSEDKDC